MSALSFDKVTKDYHIEKFVILSKPQYDEKNKTVSFAIAPITKGTQMNAGALGETVLFIDNGVWNNTDF